MADPRVAQAAFQRAQRFGATPRELLALAMAGLVESNFSHLRGGDRDSTGFLQQRPSQGWGPIGESVERDTLQFLRAARKLTSGGFRGSAGALAQAVQRSAFPERYDQRRGEARELLAQFGAEGARGAPAGGDAGGEAGMLLPPSQRRGLPGGGTGMLGLLQALRDGEGAAQAPRSGGGLPVPSFIAGPVMPQGRPVSSGGGGAPRGRPDITGLLAAAASLEGSAPARAGMPGAAALLGGGQGDEAGRGGGGLPARGGKRGLIQSVRQADSWADELGVPVTAKQEPGHASGGDHDPRTVGASARDYGGSEEAREALFRRVTRSLGVKGAEYKGRDINVTRNGVRWQIISRDHGTGPHLHIGWRLV